MKSFSFFKGLSWLILLNLLVKPAWILLIDREVQNRVGYENYGQYFALLNLSYVLYFLTDAGLSTMLNQHMANRRPVNINQLLLIRIFLFLLYLSACCFIGWLSGISQWKIFLFIILVQGLTSFFVFLRSMVTAGQYFTADAIFSVLDKSLMLLICGAILYTALFGTMNTLLFLQVQTICTAFSVLLVLIFILNKQIITKAPREELKKILVKVLPFALIILLMSIHYRIDGFLLERIHPQGALQAGIYASAYRLLDAGNMIGYLAASFLVPFVARHQNEKELVEDTVLKTRHGLMLFSLGIVCFAFYYAPWIQKLLYHSQSEFNSLVILLCLAVLPAYFLVHVYGSLLTATGRLRSFLLILLASVVLNLGLNLLLIPVYGASGCCIAALASQYFCGFSSMVVASRSLTLRYGTRSLVYYILSAILLLTFFYLGKMVISNVWIILATAICLCMLLLALQLGVIKKKYLSIP